MGNEKRPIWRREIDWFDLHIIKCFRWFPVMKNRRKKSALSWTWSPESRWPYHLIGKVEAFDLSQSLFTLDPSTSTKSLQFSTSVAKNKTCTQLFPASILICDFILFWVSTSLFVSQQKDFTSHHVTSLLLIVLSEETCLVVASKNTRDRIIFLKK